MCTKAFLHWRGVLVFVVLAQLGSDFVMDAGFCLAEDSIKAPCELVSSLNTFGVDVYNNIKQRPGNAFFSPFSVSSSLAMTRAGARGQTAQQMNKVMHLDCVRQPSSAFQELSRSLIITSYRTSDIEPPVKLNLTNDLWIQKNLGILKPFLEEQKNIFSAMTHELDFSADSEKARQSINSELSRKSEGMIEELLKKGDIDSLTRLVLTSVVYFKGKWALPFEKRLTNPRPFHFSGSKVADVPTMMRKGPYATMEGEDYRAVELDYAEHSVEGDGERGGVVSMLILVPNDIEGLPKLEGKMTQSLIQETIYALVKNGEDVTLYLPRFSLEARYQLKDVLQSLGMRDAFSFGQADFSGIDGSKELAITSILHQAKVEVTEEGTEAAAATAVIAAARGMMPRSQAFHVDRPFIFLIRDKNTNTILFMGRVVSPA